MMATGNPFFWMLVGHFLADYPLQGDWLSKAKNPTFEIVPGESIWMLAMLGHCIIHSAVVVLVTGSMALGFAEFCAHFLIDTWKCKGGLTYQADQWAHILCKSIWCAALGFMA